MGLDIYLSWPEAEQKWPDVESVAADIPSKANPKHISNRTYLRSSYNGSGFDSVAGNLTGHGLGWVFEKMLAGGDDPNSGDFSPTDAELEHARIRAIQLRDMMAGAPELAATFERAQSLRPQDGLLTSEEAALETYLEETGRENPFAAIGGGGWSNAKGVFYPDEPLEIHAVMPGRGLLGDIGVYLIYKKDLTYYKEMCEIIIEFIDEALSHPGRTVGWSG